MALPEKVLLKPDQFDLVRNELIRDGVFIVSGMNSFFCPSMNKKFLDITTAKMWPNLGGSDEWMTPGEAARTELKREFPDLKRIGWRGPHKRLFSVPMPMYCTHSGKFSGAYIDLKAAYWQVYRNLWLDVRFPCGMGSLELRPIAERLKNWKSARNSLIGVTRSMVSSGYKNGRRIQLYPDNPFLTPHLWSTIQYTLHGLASIAFDLGARYCMTDGYLIPDDQANYFLNTLDLFGIAYRVHWGEIDIKGWTSYRVEGYKTTKAYQRGLNTQTGVSNLVNDYDDPYKFIDFVFVKGAKYYEKQETIDNLARIVGDGPSSSG